jgi:hypothetical protein
MRFFLTCCAATLLATPALPADLLKSVPLRFEQAGKGPYPWIARGSAYAAAFNAQGSAIAVGDRVIRLRLAGASHDAKAEPSGAFKTPTQYFRGREAHTVAAFSRLAYRSVYPGIDIVYHGTHAELEYDFEIAAGADPSAIALRFEGADSVKLGEDGQVTLTAGASRMVQKLPSVYQRGSGDKTEAVPARYVLDSDGTLRFHLAGYDKTRALVVDPNIVIAAFLPGTGAEGAVAIAKDAQGLLYMAGYTYSTDFALVGDSYQPFLANGLRDGWVMKLDPNADLQNVIVYSSFLGGSATEDIKAMTVDNAGILYVTGTTDSVDFPVTPSGYVSSWSGGVQRVFFSVLDTTLGQDGLLYSTIFAGTSGNDAPTAIAVAGGKAYLTGFTTSDDFPLVNAVQYARGGGYDAFLAEFDPAQSGNDSLLFSTYLGGTAQDVSRTLAVDAAGRVYLAGYTYSGDFPTSTGAYRTSYRGGGDIFLTRINPETQSIEYSTYLGGSGTDQAKKIVLDPDGHVAIAGFTTSFDLPVTQNALEPASLGNGDVFLMIFDPSAQPGAAILYSSYFGGSDGDVAYDLRRDAKGRYYLCGYTLSLDFEVRNALNPVSADGGVDGFVAVIDPSLPFNNQLIYSSYLTGSGSQVAYALEVLDSGTIFVTGNATAGIFPEGYAAPVIPSNTNVFLLGFQP